MTNKKFLKHIPPPFPPPKENFLPAKHQKDFKDVLAVSLESFFGPFAVKLLELLLETDVTRERVNGGGSHVT